MKWTPEQDDALRKKAKRRLRHVMAETYLTIEKTDMREKAHEELPIVPGSRVEPAGRRWRKQMLLSKNDTGTVVEIAPGGFFPSKVRLDNGRIVTHGVWRLVDCDQSRAALVEFTLAGGCTACYGEGMLKQSLRQSGTSTTVNLEGCPRCGKVKSRW